MIYSTFHRGGGGTLPLVASPLSLGGGAHDRHDQRGDARHHRPGVSGRDYRRFCGGNGPQQRRWFRNAVAAYRGREGADSVGRKPSRWMGGRRGGTCADRTRNAQSYTWTYTSGDGRGQIVDDSRQRWKLWRRKLLIIRYERQAFRRICDFHNLFGWRRCPQQHAAVAGRGPLEARGISYAARKGAAV